MSEGDNEIRPPLPFSIPETDEECDSDESAREDRQIQVDHLLDCPITELTTRSLIPPPDNRDIQNKPLTGAHPNITMRPPKRSVESDVRLTEMDINFLARLPTSPPASGTSIGHTSGDVPSSQTHGRPKPFVPPEAERMRVRKNLFPEIRVGKTNAVWSNRETHSIVNELGSFRPRTPVGTANPVQTCPKLLAGVEIFSPPHPPPGLGYNMKYASRTGVGYPVVLPDGRTEYQYFEPIQPERVQEQETSINPGGNPLRGYDVIPDQGHFDPLLEGGTNRSAFARQPGLQKIINEVAAVPLPCGKQSTYAVPHELYRGTPLAEARQAVLLNTEQQTRSLLFIYGLFTGRLQNHGAKKIKHSF